MSLPSSQRLWVVLHSRVQEWRADSGIKETRQHQREAREQMLQVLKNPNQILTDRRSHLLRLWLVNVSRHMSLNSLNGDVSLDCDHLVLQGIPECLAPWQMVTLDRLRFIGVDGVTAEIRCRPGDTASWWITLTWAVPILN